MLARLDKQTTLNYKYRGAINLASFKSSKLMKIFECL